MARTFRGYEIQRKIGSGGMSTLYLGIQKALNREVALKMLHPGLADDASFIARFEREAQASSGIGHRNIVSVFDFGEEDDVYYIVMEYVQGLDLKDVLEKTKKIPPEIVLALLEEVSYGLEAAHSQGVIHRDIKPSNVMLSEGGEVKIADFGLARQSSDIARMSALTMPGSVLGTPAYMSPEQAAGKEVDHRTDIYSLGVMAYELFTGRKPFIGSSYSEIRDQIINTDPTPVKEGAAVTPEVEALVMRMLAKDPDRRYPTMRHVIRSIEDCMETLDPTGGLIKYRRKYITKFAQAPETFSEELRKSSISAHMDRGYYFKKMGLAKIDDAVREFQYVLYLDPENNRASSAIQELEHEAEASGIRPPKTPPAEAPEAGPKPESEVHEPTLQYGQPAAPAKEKTPPPKPVPPADFSKSGRPAILDDPPTRQPVDEKPLPGPSPERTQVLAGAEAATASDTIVSKPTKSKSKTAGRPAWLFPLGAVFGLIVAAFAVWQLIPRGGEDSATAPGQIAIRSEPTGAAVLIRGPGEEEFRSTGLVTDCTVPSLAAGVWEVRLELAGYRTQARRVAVEDGEAALSLTMAPDVQEGQIAITTEPSGAKVRVRALGETEFRELEGTTPLTTKALAAGAWEIELVDESLGTVQRTVNVGAGQVASLALSFRDAFPVGRARVTSEPPGATLGAKGPGESSYQSLDLTTPAVTDDLEVGSWTFRLDLEGYEREYRKVSIVAGEEAELAVQLNESVPVETTVGDGYATIVIVPFADVYLDGRLFENQARRTVVPIPTRGTHQLELRHPTFGTRRFEVSSVAVGDTLNLGRHDFAYCDVRIYCRPGVPADLYVDGAKQDRQTPYSGKLRSGRSRIGVRKNGFSVKEVVVHTGAGERRLSPNRGMGEVDVDLPSDAEVRIEFVLEKDG